MIPEKVARVLKLHGLTALEFEPGSTPTSSAAAARIGVKVGQIAKSLLFRLKDGTFHLILCAGDRRIAAPKLKELLGGKASMASPEETFKLTGFYPGGVCPFGVADLPIYIDKSLEAYDTVYPAAGNDASGVPTDYKTLLLLCGGKSCDVCEAPAEQG